MGWRGKSFETNCGTVKADAVKVVAGRGRVRGSADASRLRRALAVVATCIVNLFVIEVLVFVEQTSADQVRQVSR